MTAETDNIALPPGMCPTCEGDGQVCTNFGIDATGQPDIIVCPRCNGTGQRRDVRLGVTGNTVTTTVEFRDPDGTPRPVTANIPRRDAPELFRLMTALAATGPGRRVVATQRHRRHRRNR